MTRHVPLYKLAAGDGDGLNPYLTEKGAFLGDGTPLLQRDETGKWASRSQTELEALLSVGYQIEVNLSSRMESLALVARRLNAWDGDVRKFAEAQIALLLAGFPPLPSLAHGRRMAKADALGKYRAGQPRKPAGEPDGGQFTAEAASGTRHSKPPRKLKPVAPKPTLHTLPQKPRAPAPFSGPHMADTPDNRNKGRALTLGEIAALRGYTKLTDAQLRAVRIKFGGQFMNSQATTYSDGVHLEPSRAMLDFSKNPEEMALLAHELVHTFQYNNVDGSGGGVRMLLNEADVQLNDKKGGYRYLANWDTNTPYQRLNIETQASMMEDLYRLEHGLRAQSAGHWSRDRDGKPMIATGDQPDAERLRDYIFAPASHS